MNVSMFNAAAAMSASNRWQELVAENLAASAVPGYKKRELTFEAVRAGSTTPAGQEANAAVPYFQFPKAVSATNFTPGGMRQTGVATDLAIDGKGFFEVQLPNGSTAYTRDGEFTLNAQGQLITKQGYLVLGDSGPVQLDLANRDPLSIAASGEISQGSELKGKLKLTEFADERQLDSSHGGYFVPADPSVTGTSSTGSTVRQGWLEGSNINVAAEMANMITALRTFEANQRVIQIQDERTGKAINELGNS